MPDTYTHGYEPEDDEPSLPEDRPEATKTALYGWNRSTGTAGRRRRKRRLVRITYDVAAVRERMGRILA